MASTRLFLTGANYPRVDYVRDPLTGLYLPGYRLEPERIQICRYSRAHNSWSALRASVPTTSATAPDGSATADVLHEDATAAQSHSVYCSPTAAIVAGATYCYSTFARTINRPWVALMEAGALRWRAYFNLSTGAVGAMAGNALSRRIEDYGGGWYRCILTFTGTVGDLLGGFVAEGDADYLFDGLNQDSLYVWGSQLEAGLYPSSQIINDGVADVIRTADSALIYDITGIVTRPRGLCMFPFRMPIHAPAADLDIVKLYLAATPAADYIKFSAEATTGALKVTSARTGGATPGTVIRNTNICDGNVHWLSAEWDAGLFTCYVDGTQAATPAGAVDLPVPDRISCEPCGGWTGKVMVWEVRPDGYLQEFVLPLEPPP